MTSENEYTALRGEKIYRYEYSNKLFSDTITFTVSIWAAAIGLFAIFSFLDQDNNVILLVEYLQAALFLLPPLFSSLCFKYSLENSIRINMLSEYLRHTQMGKTWENMKSKMGLFYFNSDRKIRSIRTSETDSKIKCSNNNKSRSKFLKSKYLPYIREELCGKETPVNNNWQKVGDLLPTFFGVTVVSLVISIIMSISFVSNCLQLPCINAPTNQTSTKQERCCQVEEDSPTISFVEQNCEDYKECGNVLCKTHSDIFDIFKMHYLILVFVEVVYLILIESVRACLFFHKNRIIRFRENGILRFIFSNRYSTVWWKIGGGVLFLLSYILLASLTGVGQALTNSFSTVTACFVFTFPILVYVVMCFVPNFWVEIRKANIIINENIDLVDDYFKE